MSRAWVVRSGEGTKEIDAMRAAGRVGLRYEEVGDARVLTPREIEHALATTHDEGVDTLRGRLMRFVNDIRVGDLLVIPNAADHEVWVSVVTGPYEFSEDPAVPRFRHTRTAEWTGWLDRRSPWLQHKLTYIDTPAAVVELRDPDWWLQMVGLHDLPTERPVRRLPIEPPKPARARRPSAPRAPTPRAVASKEPDRALCAGQCGFQWRTSVLVGGLCPDCRGE